MASAKSRKLIRRVTIKIFAPGNVVFQRRIILAGGGRVFTEDGIQKLLEDTADEIDRRMPGHDYELVELQESASFNFVCRGERANYVDPRLKAIFDGKAEPAHA